MFPPFEINSLKIDWNVYIFFYNLEIKIDKF